MKNLIGKARVTRAKACIFSGRFRPPSEFVRSEIRILALQRRRMVTLAPSRRVGRKPRKLIPDSYAGVRKGTDNLHVLVAISH
jgi:hypothetical protein